MTSSRPQASATYEIEQAVFSTLVANVFGSFYWVDVLMNLAPWRSVRIAVGLTTIAAVGWNLEDNPLPFLAAWGVSVILFVTEVAGRRTFVTGTHIVAHRGLFGRSSRAYPLGEVREVTYRYPSFGRSLHVGDIEILGDGWALSVVGVKQPEEHAQRLLDRKNAA